MPFVVVGVATGSVYGLAAMGLVLTYKTSGIFNFAHGAVGTVAAYAFYELHASAGMPWPLAALVAVAGVAVVSGLGFEHLARRLANVDTGLKVVATVGVLVAVQGLAVVRYGPEARKQWRHLPDDGPLFNQANGVYDADHEAERRNGPSDLERIVTVGIILNAASNLGSGGF